MYERDVCIEHRWRVVSSVTFHRVARVYCPSGISDLIALVRGAVIKEIGSCSLKDSLTAANVSSIVAGVRQRIEGTPRNGCSPRIRGGDLGRFVMAPIDETPDEVHTTACKLFLHKFAD